MESLFPTLKRGANQVAAATASGAFAVLNKAHVYGAFVRTLLMQSSIKPALILLDLWHATPTQRVPRYPGRALSKQRSVCATKVVPFQNSEVGMRLKSCPFKTAKWVCD